MKLLTPAQFKITLAAVAAVVSFVFQHNLIPAEFLPVVGFLSAYLVAGIIRPGTKSTKETTDA